MKAAILQEYNHTITRDTRVEKTYAHRPLLLQLSSTKHAINQSINQSENESRENDNKWKIQSFRTRGKNKKKVAESVHIIHGYTS